MSILSKKGPARFLISILIVAVFLASMLPAPVRAFAEETSLVGESAGAPEGAPVGGSEGAAVEGSEGAAVEGSEGAAVEGSEGAAVEGSEGAADVGTPTEGTEGLAANGTPEQQIPEAGKILISQTSAGSENPGSVPAAEGGEEDDPAAEGGEQGGPAAEGGEQGGPAAEGGEQGDPAAEGGEQGDPEGPGLTEESPALSVAFSAMPENAKQGDPGWTVSYDYNAALYDPESGDYPGVYAVKVDPNSESAENAPTIGMPSIADKNLDTPTTESPAIIQGAAVSYEEKTGPVEYTKIEGRPDKPDPYSEYQVKIMEEQAQDGTTHKKPTGFDGTYVIVRVDVSSFYDAGAGAVSGQYLHVKQENNKALMPAMGMTEGKNEFTTQQGTRTGSYLMSDLVDGETPYLDILLYSTAGIVAGADAGKDNIPNGDVPLQLYVDDTADYNPGLTYDPASTDTTHADQCLAKFFDATKAGNGAISRYTVKGSDLALEIAVENSSGENKDQDTTYWSLTKGFEDPYYDQEIDSSASDPNCGRTLKLISEVAITDGLTLAGTDADSLKKRTLDVNSFDVQIANNNTTDAQTYSDGMTLKNAWLTIADNSNTTGAEMAIGNNARFIIDQGGKLIIDDTCQLEIEWDAGTTTPAEGQAQPSQPDILNNGMLDLRAGGEIVNNGIITIEGFEGKPVPDGQQPSQDAKGCGEMTICEGATLTNNGSFVVYGKLYNLGTLVNNGHYADVIESNDPDKGVFAYHKGILISWKDDVTQPNVQPGALYNGQDRDGNASSKARLINNGDIVLDPGTLENYVFIQNSDGQNIYLGVATEAIIPITPDPNTPTVVTKRITLDKPVASALNNYGLIYNSGRILPASVAINDNGGLGALTTPGDHPELFAINNNGVVINSGSIYGWVNEAGSMAAAEVRTPDGARLILYRDRTFLLIFADGSTQSGTYAFVGDALVFTLSDGTTVEPDGNGVYSFRSAAGQETPVFLSAELLASLR